MHQTINVKDDQLWRHKQKFVPPNQVRKVSKLLFASYITENLWSVNTKLLGFALKHLHFFKLLCCQNFLYFEQLIWFTTQICAGKTTILYQMKVGQIVKTIPTIGFNVETIKPCKGITLTVWDVGGQTKLRTLWKHYYQGAGGKLFAAGKLWLVPCSWRCHRHRCSRGV